MGRGEEAAETRFEIFRRADAVSLEESGIMTMPEMPDETGIAAVMQAGPDCGYLTRVLYATPKFSLVYLWYKSGYMLPRHTHNVDCLYVVIGGSLKIGTETLKPGDGFFVGTDVPYGYTAGEQGVEVLEFRSGNDFDIKVFAGDAFWGKAAASARSRQETWATETSSPTGITTPGSR